MVRLQLGQRSKPSSLGASFSPHPAQCHLSMVSNGDGLGSRSSVKKTSVSRRSNSRLKPMPLFWQTRSPSGPAGGEWCGTAKLVSTLIK